MIAVVDYCKGNLKSVERGLRAVGGDAHITDNPEVIRAADAVVLPGVGSFADASQHMVESGQLEAVRDAIAAGKPFLGICLGEHLLFEAGVEGAAGPGVDGGFKIGSAEELHQERSDGNPCAEARIHIEQHELRNRKGHSNDYAKLNRKPKLRILKTEVVLDKVQSVTNTQSKRR